MARRRDILQTSLSVCGCAACGALGIGSCGRDARADSPTAIGGAAEQRLACRRRDRDIAYLQIVRQTE